MTSQLHRFRFFFSQLPAVKKHQKQYSCDVINFWPDPLVSKKGCKFRGCWNLNHSCPIQLVWSSNQGFTLTRILEAPFLLGSKSPPEKVDGLTASRYFEYVQVFRIQARVFLCPRFSKVHIFWEGHKILRNLPLTFDCMYVLKAKGEDFAKFCGLLRIYELYKESKNILLI